MHYRNKILRILISAVLVVCMTAGIAFASYGTAVITASSLRLRQQANTSSSTLDYAYRGEEVELLSDEVNGWYQVSYKGKTGYMSADWLKVVTTGSSTSTQTGKVNAGPLNVRSGPGITYKRIGSLSKGASVTILETLNGWYKVSAGSVTGYVSAQYITPDAPVQDDIPGSGSSSDSSTTIQTGTTTAGLNVRTGPGTGYSKVATLSKGTTVTILETTGNWYKITAGSVTGYVNAPYVKLNAPVTHYHSYTEEVVDPTCTDQGYTLHTCSDCGHSYQDSETEAVGHSYTESIVEPTCDEKGCTLHTCSACGHSYEDNETDATGHSYTEEVVEPTTQDQGYTLYTCSVCGHSYKDNFLDKLPGEDSEPVVQTGKVNAGPLNVRSGPGTSYSKIGSLNKGASVTILETADGWYKISAGSLTGYVSAQYITADAASDGGDSSDDDSAPTRGMVKEGPLNVRSGPGTGYSKIGSLRAGTAFTILETADGWYKISTGSLTGYVSADYVIILSDSAEPSAAGAQAAAMAVAQLGKPYVYGAAGPNAFDCSGLSYYIYGQLGYSISRGSSSQYQNDGYFVSIEDIQPGDLVFIFDSKYDYSGGTLPTTHMGIYVGGGKFIHASTSGYVVKYADLYSSYYSKYIVGIKRIA